MGQHDLVNLIPFTTAHVADKQLVIKMLQFETAYAKSDAGRELYATTLNKPLISLNVEKTLNRITLSEFGFDTTDESVETFRTIFKTYYKSPTDFDVDVINASYYMKGNKLMYYQMPELALGQKIPDCDLLCLDETVRTLFSAIAKMSAKYTVIAAFSLS